MPFANQRPFRQTGDAVTIAASVASNRGQIRMNPENVSNNLLLVNSTNAVAFFVTGDSNAVATVAGIPVPAGCDRIIEMPGGHTHVAVILAAGAVAGNVYAQIGNGGT